MRRVLIFVLPVVALALASCRPVDGSGQAAAAPPSASPAPPPSVAPSPSAPPPRVLKPGMRGRAVRLLQQRLAALKYYPGRVDGRFGSATLEAVWAFQETQRMHPRNAVGPAMQRALASPRPPRVLVRHGGPLRVEVNIRDQVLVLYKRNHVALVSHVSTAGGYYYCSTNGCADATTPTGDFTTLSFVPGWVTVPLGEMYNPVFFLGTTFAIHGDADVPLRAASHGCVRIPMDIAAFFYKLVPTPGTPVYIRG